MNIPLPGYAVIAPESKYQDTGLITIPNKFMGRTMSVGRVLIWKNNFKHRCKDCGNVQMTGGHCRRCQRNRVFPISKSHLSPFGLEDITGLRVIYIEAAMVPLAGTDHFRIPIDDIIAVIDNTVVIGGSERDHGIKRCTRCGPAKEGSPNAMIMQNVEGKVVCPRCKRDVDGNVHKF